MRKSIEQEALRGRALMLLNASLEPHVAQQVKGTPGVRAHGAECVVEAALTVGAARSLTTESCPNARHEWL